MSRNFGTNDRLLRYKRINTHFFTDTFFVGKGMTSARGFKCVQLFVSDKGFICMVPMVSKGEFPKALKEFCKEVGVPRGLIVDPSGEQTSSEVKWLCHNVAMNLKVL